MLQLIKGKESKRKGGKKEVLFAVRRFLSYFSSLYPLHIEQYKEVDKFKDTYHTPQLVHINF